MCVSDCECACTHIRARRLCESTHVLQNIRASRPFCGYNNIIIIFVNYFCFFFVLLVCYYIRERIIKSMLIVKAMQETSILLLPRFRINFISHLYLYMHI